MILDAILVYGIVYIFLASTIALLAHVFGMSFVAMIVPATIVYVMTSFAGAVMVLGS